MEHLEIVTPPGFEPVALADMKQHLRVEIPDDDALISSLITAARMHAEVVTRQTIPQTSYAWYSDQFPASANGYFNRLVRLMGPNPQWLPNGAAILYLPKPPLVSVASVQYVDSTGVLQTVDPTTYVVSTGNGSRVQPVIGHVWPVVRPQIDGVIVRYTAGYPDAASVPEVIKAAIKLMVGHWYNNREATTSAAIGSKEIPLGVCALLGSLDGWSYA
jgi:hypothetical protein